MATLFDCHKLFGKMKTKQIEDPGAVVHGNFINYYQFNKAEERLSLLPKEIWLHEEEESATHKPYIVLDVGCNTGELTQQLWQKIQENIQGRRPVYILGIDLDETLILRAKQNNQQNEYVQYVSVNCMDAEALQPVLDKFLQTHQCNKFDVICCFSITMWIHLNYNDAGLQNFLRQFSCQTQLLLIEPQPWKCYQTAQKRLRRIGSEFPLFLKLQWRSDVEQKIDEFVQNELKMRKIYKTEQTHWQRSLYFYRE